MDQEKKVTDGLEIPEEFACKMKKLLGDEWNAFMDSYGNRNYQALRFNPLKKGIAAEQYPKYLEQLNICERIPVPWAEHAFYYGEVCSPGKHPYHEMGLYYIQEPSAMSAAALLEACPGERVLDLCAAPGGKTTQIAAAMGQQGLLLANEIHPARAKILSQNVERMGIANTLVCNEDSGRLADLFPGYFHRILVDAPCSGEGMFRKNPQAAMEWSPQNVQMCAARQGEILDNASRMLMEGGRLVYSTCTFSPEENEQVIGAFLERHPEFAVVRVQMPYFAEGHPEWANGEPQLAKTFRLWPHKLHGEGHYAAVLSKGTETAGQPVPERNAGKKTMISKEQQRQLQEFLGNTLTEETADALLDGQLTLFKDQLYRLPRQAPAMDGLHVLRAGLHLGTFKKNRFEPSHALALFLGRGDVRNAAELSTEQDMAAVEAYFRGETISAESGRGWSLVCVDGFSAGWGKLAGGMLKNHYPKGLRR